jgi:Zn-dependent peptidase ImmA (M78 family)
MAERINYFRQLIAKVDSSEHRNILRKFNLGQRVSGKPQSVVALARALGLDVDLVELERGQSGFLKPDTFAESGYCIVVNRHHSVRRRRFTVLHEIMHFLFHTDHSDPLAEGSARDLSDRHFYRADELIQEREANQGAAVLLFGEGVLSCAMAHFGGDIPAVARSFGISEIVVRKGLKHRL